MFHYQGVPILLPVHLGHRNPDRGLVGDVGFRNLTPCPTRSRIEEDRISLDLWAVHDQLAPDLRHLKQTVPFGGRTVRPS